MEIKPATRQGVKPLIGIFSESGCGKTMSSLLLARGFVGAAGKIVMVDTESGRGSLYADVIPGGYDVIEMREPFSPARYIEAVQEVEKSGAGILVIDSASHEWEGIGGVLDMANENEIRTQKTGLHNWKQPKQEHAKFMLKLLQSSLPIIVCLRAKFKTRQIKGTQELADDGIIRRDQIGKTVIVKDAETEPIQDGKFIYEMMAHGEIMQDHSLRLTKCSHPSLRDCFPVNKPIEICHGEALAAWCASAGSPAGVSSPVATTTPPKSSGGTLGEKQKLELELWTVLKSIRTPGKKGFSEVNSWLWREEILDAGKDPAENVESLTAEKMREVIKAAKAKLGQLV